MEVVIVNDQIDLQAFSAGGIDHERPSRYLVAPWQESLKRPLPTFLVDITASYRVTEPIAQAKLCGEKCLL